jgi:ribosomal protein S18 acetylase RimI-like enzyme
VLHVREATVADAERAGQIVLDAYRSLPGYEPEPDYEVELADVASRLPPVAEVLVAEEGGRLLGCATFVPGPESPLAESYRHGEAGIRMLGVDPAAHGRGIGRLLVEACIDRARSSGRAAMFLHSTSYMHGAHRMYQRLGFQRVPERDWAYLPDLLLYAFRLPLVSEQEQEPGVGPA